MVMKTPIPDGMRCYNRPIHCLVKFEDSKMLAEIIEHDTINCCHSSVFTTLYYQ